MGVVQCESMVVKAMGEAGTASMELIYYHVWEDSSRKVREMMLVLRYFVDMNMPHAIIMK